MTHHDAQLNDEGFHEIQLSGKQLVFLFMATATVLVVTFLCGVQVGRNVKVPDHPPGQNDQADTLASAVPSAAAAPSQPATASSGPPASEPPAPAPEPEDELSYAKRLQAETPPTEKLKPASPAPAAAPATAAKTAPPRSETPDTTAKTAPKPAATPQSTGRPGQWIVQLTALQDRSAANAIVRRLNGRGYPAFVLDPAPGSPGLYRVQVGGYPDRAGAEQAARRLEKEEQFKPYVRAR